MLTLTNNQLIASNNDREDLATFVAIPANSLKHPSEYTDLRVVENIVLKQLPDGSILYLTETGKQQVAEETYVTDTVPLKLINDQPEKEIARNRTILLHPPMRKQDKDKLPTRPTNKEKPIRVEPKPEHSQYKCIKCDNSFDTIEQYHNHMRWHKCQKKFRCEKCPMGYNVENNLKIHMTLMHSEGNTTKCPVCHITLTFQRMASLKSHLLLHHTEEFYTCDDCEGEYDKEEDFIKHMEAHCSKKIKYPRPLTCPYCKLEFDDVKEFRTHVTDHMKLRKTVLKNRRQRKSGTGGKKEESNHVCVICNKSFIKNSLLERHLRIHSGEKPYKCQYCDRSFTQKGTLQIHLSRHAGVKPFACTLCPARFNQKGNLGVHVQKTHTFPAEKDQKMFKCSQCACIFKKIATLNGHVTKAHLNSKDTSQLDDNLIEDVISKLKELEQQTSGNVTAKFPAKNKENKPKEHVVIENKGVEVPDFDKGNFIHLTESANDGTVRRYLVRQMKVDDIRWYFCNYCSKQFKKPSDLIRHMRVHTKEKPFKCEQCNAEFTLKTTLLSHVKTHTNKMDYTCKICNSSFISLRVLNAHLRKHDFESLPKWQCITCGYLFNQSEEGVEHREKMGRDKPHVVQPFRNTIMKQPLYQTTYGFLTFKPPKHPVPNTGSESPTLRPFHCAICDARFTKRINLKRHVLFHNSDRNFKCNLCPKTFITSYGLKEHLNYHNNVKNYACKQCDKKFVTATLLKRHVIIHNNHKPYQCPYCTKKFKTLLLCRIHINRVHMKEVIKKLNSESENLVVGLQPRAGQNNAGMVSVASEINVLQNLPHTADNENMTMLAPEGNNCIQIMNADGTLTDVNKYSTVFVNMNDLQFLDNSNLNLTVTNESENTGSLLNPQENLQVNDIIFDIDLKPGLSLPPEEIFEASIEAEQVSNALPSAADVSTKLVKLDNFSEENTGANTSILNNSSDLYSNINFNSCLSLPITVGENDAILDANTSSTVLQQACAADMSHVDNIYESTNIMCINCSRMFTSFDTFQAHNCTLINNDTVQDKNEHESKELIPDGFDQNRELNLKETIEDKSFSNSKTRNVKSNITCNTCKTVMNSKAEYVKHLATAHKARRGSGTKSCKFCFKDFKKPSDLKRHLRTHTGERPFGCHMCGKTFSLKSTLESHIKTHDPAPKRYNCNVCSSFFSSKSSLKVHMMLHTGQKPYSCSFCDLKFRTVGNRKSHEVLMHLSKSRKSGQSKQTKVKNLLESVASGIISSLSEIQPNPDSCLEDNRDHVENTPTKLGIEEQDLSSQVLTTENLLSTLQDDSLPMDPVLLLQQLQMSGLVLTNEHNEPVSTLLLDDGTILNIDGMKDSIPELSLQPAEIQEPENMNINNNNVPVPAVAKPPEKVRNLECDICHKMYASRDVLRKHRKKVHGVNKKYPCIKCDRAYDTQDELGKHNKWHDGYRAFSCAYCTNSFMEESRLKVHMKRMHQHSNATKTTTSALLDVNFDLASENIDDPLLNNLFTFKKIV